MQLLLYSLRLDDTSHLLLTSSHQESLSYRVHEQFDSQGILSFKPCLPSQHLMHQEYLSIRSLVLSQLLSLVVSPIYCKRVCVLFRSVTLWSSPT